MTHEKRWFLKPAIALPLVAIVVAVTVGVGYATLKSNDNGFDTAKGIPSREVCQRWAAIRSDVEDRPGVEAASEAPGDRYAQVNSELVEINRLVMDAAGVDEKNIGSEAEQNRPLEPLFAALTILSARRGSDDPEDARAWLNAGYATPYVRAVDDFCARR